VKAQLSWEFVVTVLLFVMSSVYFLFIIFQLSPSVKMGIEAETKRAKAFKISEILIRNPGEPSDWEKEYFGPALWSYRLPINVSGIGNGFSDYSILLLINTSYLISQGKMNSSCKDIRFTDSNFQLLPYYLEKGCNSDNTSIWVRMDIPPYGKNETIYMYYGDLSLESSSNAKRTFDFFDDFENLTYANERWEFENKE